MSLSHQSKQKKTQNYNTPRWGIARSAILFLIRVYKRTLSLVLGGQCRFYPTCSSYSVLCFTYLPMHKAFWYSLARIFRCNPYAEGGVDYPPGVSKEIAEEYMGHHL